MVLLNPPKTKRPNAEQMAKELIKSIPKKKVSPAEAITVFELAIREIAAREHVDVENLADNLQEMIRANPPVKEDLLQSAPIAVANAALVTAFSSWCETQLKPQFAQSAKPELYAKLSGAAAGAALTAASYVGAKMAEDGNVIPSYFSTPLLVGGAVALGIRLLTAFVPNWFANPALPQTATTATTSTTAAVTGDYLNVSHVPRKLSSRMVVAQPTKRALSGYATVPEIQSAATRQVVALRSPFSGTPVVRE